MAFARHESIRSCLDKYNSEIAKDLPDNQVLQQVADELIDLEVFSYAVDVYEGLKAHTS